MLIKNWCTAVACAAVAGGALLVPGTAHAASPDCTIVVIGERTPEVEGLGSVVVTGQTAITCATDYLSGELGLVQGFVWVSIVADYPGSGSVECARSLQVPLVAGTAADVVVGICAPGATNYTAHHHSELQYTSDLTSTPPGCVHTGFGTMTCTVSTNLIPL